MNAFWILEILADYLLDGCIYNVSGNMNIENLDYELLDRVNINNISDEYLMESHISRSINIVQSKKYLER